MNKKKGNPRLRDGLISHFNGALIISLNVILICAALLMYITYNNAYKKSLRDENIGNIANMNQSAALNITALFDSWDVKLDDITSYIELQDMTVGEALDLIREINDNEDWYFELIGSDRKGYLARYDDNGVYPELDYSHTSYSLLHKIFDNAESGDKNSISFAPEYTDGGLSAQKFLAKYKFLSLKNDNGDREAYTLFLATPADKVLDRLNRQTDYPGQSSVLIDALGNYIVSSSDYKSANFFQYLYVYNDLTLDRKYEIQREMNDSGSGELYFKNSGIVVEECVYRYDLMEQDGWYCVTAVPISAFRKPAFNATYIIYALFFVVALLVIDVLWFQYVNRKLRTSARRESEANMAKGNFMSRMSHEIRTPLNAVIGYNTIAQNEIHDATNDVERKQAEMKVIDCLIKSEIASKHLLTIINDVLDMSAIESGKISISHERFDFKGLITSLTTVFYTQARNRGIDFEVIFDSLTEEWFIGDQMRVNQILTNLLSNAIKFTPDGGSVILKITQPDTDDNASHMHFEVTDTGIGMTQEYISHIWTPFEQADSTISRRFGGSGLGLSITKNLIDLMNGNITVTSSPDKGSTFSVDLVFDRTEQPNSTDTYDFSGISALVVDDDPGTCDYIRLLFNRSGAKCAAVTSGFDAIKAVSVAHERGEKYTVCFVDWHMPELNGIDTIQRINEITGNDTPIIVITAYDYSEIEKRAHDIGVHKFISKPLFQSSLFDLLVNITGNNPVKPIAKNKALDFHGRRLLLAEDNTMNMEIAKTIMESAGLIVDCAWNGREAVDIFEASVPGTYLVILMDVHMPVLNGHEATREIRSSSHPEAKTIPIIAMTADAFAENVAEAELAGMNGHISKPIDVSILFETLTHYADKQ